MDFLTALRRHPVVSLVVAVTLLACSAVAIVGPPSEAREGFSAARAEVDMVSVPTVLPSARSGTSGGVAFPGQGTVDLSINASVPGPPIPMDFLGLSYEVKYLPLVASFAQRGDLVSLLRSLGTGVLRFGGVTADTQVAWSDPATTPRPSWATAALVPNDLYNLADLARTSGWRVLLTVNLGHFDPAAAADEARVAAAALGRSLEAIEIGNEPTAFVLDHLRRAPYSFSTYRQEVAAYIAAIRAAAPQVAIAGPDGASGATIVSWMRAEATEVRPALLTSHFYGASCRSLPTVAFLMSRQIQKPEEADLRALARVGHKYRIPVRLDETNNISCGGLPGVSDTYAAALWAVGLLTRTLHAPFVGINFHGFLSAPNGYSPIAALTPSDLASGAISARPEWYALLLAHQVQGDRPLRLSVKPRGLNVAIWAGRTSAGDVQTIIDDEQPRGSRPLLFNLTREPGTRAASVLRLTGRSFSATTGVTLGGRSVSPDGSWMSSGVPHAKLSRRFISVVVDPQSAALVSAER